MPLHHQVYLDLREALDAGEWTEAEQLPTERELAADYGCSLITVRRALDELVREGRLERTRGRGTFVTSPPIVRDIMARAGFADEMRARGLTPYAAVISAREEPAAPAVAAALCVTVGAQVHYLERVRGADGVPLLLEQAYLPIHRFPGLLAHDYASASLYEVLDRVYGCPVVRTWETISAHVPDTREARLLGLHARRPSLRLEGSAFTTGAIPVEFSRTVVSGERARYFIETSGGRVRSLEPVDFRGREEPAAVAPPSRPTAAVGAVATIDEGRGRGAPAQARTAPARGARGRSTG